MGRVNLKGATTRVINGRRVVLLSPAGNPIKHGRSGYTNYGCRCEICTVDHTIKHKDYMHNHPEQQQIQRDRERERYHSFQNGDYVPPRVRKGRVKNRLGGGIDRNKPRGYTSGRQSTERVGMKFYRIVVTQISLTTVSVRQERWEPDMEEWVEVKQTYKVLRGWIAAMEYAEVLSRSVVDEIAGS